VKPAKFPLKGPRARRGAQLIAPPVRL
jgi:hypothetical protein